MPTMWPSTSSACHARFKEVTMTTQNWNDWIGRSQVTEDIASLSPVLRLAATLDRDSLAFSPENAVPLLAHWLYFLPCEAQSELGADGHARKGTSGGLLPPVDLPRRMWAGSQIQFHKAIPIGSRIERTSRIGNISDKEGRTGRLVFVKVVHEVRVAGELVRRDGFTQSIITGQKQDDRNYEAFRVSLLFKPSDRIENLLMVDYRNTHNNGSGMVIRALNPNVVISSVPFGAATRGGLQFAGVAVPPASVTALPITLGGTVNVGCLSATLAGCPAPVLGSGALGAYAAALQPGGGFFLIAPTSTFNQILATQAAIGPRQNQNNQLSFIKEHTFGITNRTKIELSDSLTLKNVISYRKTRNNEALNYTGTPLPLLLQNGPWTPNNSDTFGQEQFTEELQLQGKSIPRT